MVESYSTCREFKSLSRYIFNDKNTVVFYNKTSRIKNNLYIYIKIKKVQIGTGKLV